MYYYKFFPDSDSEICLTIGEYLIKLRRTKMVPIFGPPCIWHIHHDSRTDMEFLCAILGIFSIFTFK